MRRLTTTWPDESEPRCHRCCHWEVSHAQGGGQCFWRCDNGDARMNAERLCRCRGYKMGAAELPKPAAPDAKGESPVARRSKAIILQTTRPSRLIRV